MTNWIGDSGNWSTAGEWDAGVPDSTHAANFNAGSFSTTGLTVTVDAVASCLDLDFTGATNSPTFTQSAGYVGYYGNVTLIVGMSLGPVLFSAKGAIDQVFTSAGNSFTNQFQINGHKLTLNGDISTNNWIMLMNGEFDTDGYTVDSTSLFLIYDNTNVRVFSPGNSVVNCSVFRVDNATNFSVSANTATINCSGNFAGGSLDYNGATLNLTGATSTVSGSNTFATLALPSGTTQTITITDGTTQSAKTFTLSGDAKHTHTITGTASAGYTLTATGGGTVYMDYVNMSYCTATGATFLYGPHCTMTSCTGWKPAPRYSFLPRSI